MPTQVISIRKMTARYTNNDLMVRIYDQKYSVTATCQTLLNSVSSHLFFIILHVFFFLQYCLKATLVFDGFGLQSCCFFMFM